MQDLGGTALGADYGLGPAYFPGGFGGVETPQMAASLLYLGLAQGRGAAEVGGLLAELLLRRLAELGGDPAGGAASAGRAMYLSPALAAELGAPGAGWRRLAALGLCAMLLPGYRAARRPPGAGGALGLGWVLAPGLPGGAPESGAGGEYPREAALRGWLRAYAPGARRPYDVAALAQREYGGIGPPLWRPLRRVGAGDLLGPAPAEGAGPNQVPPPAPRARIVGEVQPLDAPLLADLSAALALQPSLEKALAPRWAAALLSDAPWLPYQSPSPAPDAPGFASAQYTGPPQTAEFEAWWEERLGLVPTFRQALGAALGFEL